MAIIFLQLKYSYQNRPTLERVKIIIFQTVLTNPSENPWAKRSEISWKLHQDLTAIFLKKCKAVLSGTLFQIVLIRELPPEKLTKFPSTKGLPQIIDPSSSPHRSVRNWWLEIILSYFVNAIYYIKFLDETDAFISSQHRFQVGRSCLNQWI